MIVWGGLGTVDLRDGRRYSPGANAWTTVAATGAPSVRKQHTVVWTGTEMFVWGGFTGAGSYLSDGGRYNASTNSWLGIATSASPGPRYDHTAVWSGTEMIVWGGTNGTVFFNDGGRYNPATNAWLPLTTNQAPSPRAQHTAIWTGGEMIVWGGTDGNAMLRRRRPLQSLRVVPAGQWTPLPGATPNAPERAHLPHGCVDGRRDDRLGRIQRQRQPQRRYARFNPTTGLWTALPPSGLAPRYWHAACWTGRKHARVRRLRRGKLPTAHLRSPTVQGLTRRQETGWRLQTSRRIQTSHGTNHK